MDTVTATPDPGTSGDEDLITEYEEHLRHLRRRKSTIEGYVGILRRMEAQMPAGLTAATQEEIENWIFEPGRGDATHGHYITVVSGFWKWATDPLHRRFDFDPTADLPAIRTSTEKPVRVATEAEYADVRARARDPYLDLYLLAGDGGLRSIEISRIDREHLTERELRVYGKGSKWRTVPTHPRIWERFGSRPPGPLAVDLRGNPLTETQVVSWGNGHLKRALGYRNLSMHSCRKRFGTALYEACGKDIRVVQEALGHASVTTTQIYIGVNMGRMASAIASLA